MLFDHKINLLRSSVIEQSPNRPYNNWEDICGIVCDYIKPYFMDDGGMVIKILEWAEKQKHVMKFTRTKAIFTLFSQLRGGIINILEYNENTEYELNEEQIKAYFGKFLMFSQGFTAAELNLNLKVKETHMKAPLPTIISSSIIIIKQPQVI